MILARIPLLITLALTMSQGACETDSSTVVFEPPFRSADDWRRTRRCYRQSDCDITNDTRVSFKEGAMVFDNLGCIRGSARLPLGDDRLADQEPERLVVDLEALDIQGGGRWEFDVAVTYELGARVTFESDPGDVDRVDGATATVTMERGTTSLQTGIGLENVGRSVQLTTGQPSIELSFAHCGDPDETAQLRLGGLRIEAW